MPSPCYVFRGQGHVRLRGVTLALWALGIWRMVFGQTLGSGQQFLHVLFCYSACLPTILPSSCLKRQGGLPLYLPALACWALRLRAYLFAARTLRTATAVL